MSVLESAILIWAGGSLLTALILYLNFESLARDLRSDLRIDAAWDTQPQAVAIGLLVTCIVWPGILLFIFAKAITQKKGDG